MKTKTFNMLVLLFTLSVLVTACDLIGAQSDTSENPVLTPDDDQIGMSELVRDSDKIALNIDACCVTPGHAYTAWWAIGDVTKSMSAVHTELAHGWVADSEQVALTLTLDVGEDGIKDPLEGIRIMVLDHGQDTGNPRQLTSPTGGCSNGRMCPEVMNTAHAGTDGKTTDD